MKTIFLLVSISMGLLILGSCGDGIAPNGGEILPKIDTFNCPKAEFLPAGQGPKYPPKKSHKLQRRSPDGTKIAYLVNDNTVKIVNLTTGIVETYEPAKMMPPNVTYIGSGELQWCPYDDNKLCFVFTTGIDTTGSGGFGVYGQNLFILYRKEHRFERVDLPYMPQSGPVSLFIYGWLSGSTPSIDSLFLAYGTETAYTGILIIQEKKNIPIREFDNFWQIGFLRDYLYSPNGKHSAALVEQLRVPPYFDHIFIDGIALKIPDDTISLLSRLSWSPDSKKLAVTLQVKHKYETVWVIDVEKWLRERPDFAPVEKIDFQKRFCMYNLSSNGSIDAEFITNTTLAVSSHHDGDMLCPLWEITTDGRLLRQITHDD